MFRSAVFKLTAAYVGIVMTICIVFSVVLDHFAVRELHNGFYNQYSRLYDAYQRFGLHQPGTPAQELALRSHHILMQILYFNLFVLVLTTVASYLLARRTLRPIEAAHEQQKRFTADVSHELRTPLTALKMETEVTLLDPKAPAKALRQTLRSNLEEVERMDALINTLLLLSSMEAGKLRTQFVRFDVAQVVQNAIDSVEPLAAAAQVIIKADVSPNMVRGDRASLTQLFVILLSNAIKYSLAGAEVSVGIRQTKGRVVIAVSDTGTGIPAAALPHVFDRFYRADDDRSRSASATTPGNASAPEGYGIGLSLAKLIADLHGAEIIISSSTDPHGSGTTAQVVLSTKL